MNVGEVFESVSGEVGTNIPQGSFAMFVRFAGCSLKCNWCDAKKTWWHNAMEMNLLDMEIIFKTARTKNLIVTGGEPFEQKEILPFLRLAKQYFDNIAVETSGYKLPMEEMLTEFRDIALIVDYKPLSANVKVPDEEINNLTLFKSLSKNDVIKFPFCDTTDLYKAIFFARLIQSHCEKVRSDPPTLAFSPIPPEQFSWVANHLAANAIKAVINIQIHKVLNVE